ncbi:MAG: hypothetical protein ACR2M8_05685 [Pyrinomonadaceae bacterium]|nr:hypothetical protein [Blastocatellia bacterium]MDQ3491575.1 hypothetical protein [Acidobacteriota bacterium]
MAVNNIQDPRRATRRFFIFVAVLFPLLVLLGFARTYYLRAFLDGPPVPTLLVHLHGLVMTAWIVLFATQVWLISSRRIRLHQKLGIAGVFLGIVIIVVGLLTAVASAARGGGVPGIPPLAFLAVPFFDIVVFAILLAGAVYYRRQPANHKRLILLTILNFLPPAVARIPIVSLQSLGPIWFFGFPDILAVIFVIVDTWRHKKLNKVFLAGTLLMIVSHPLRLMLSGTEAWLRFATWITS